MPERDHLRRPVPLRCMRRRSRCHTPICACSHNTEFYRRFHQQQVPVFGDKPDGGRDGRSVASERRQAHRLPSELRGHDRPPPLLVAAQIQVGERRPPGDPRRPPASEDERHRPVQPPLQRHPQVRGQRFQEEDPQAPGKQPNESGRFKPLPPIPHPCQDDQHRRMSKTHGAGDDAHPSTPFRR